MIIIKSVLKFRNHYLYRRTPNISSTKDRRGITGSMFSGANGVCSLPFLGGDVGLQVGEVERDTAASGRVGMSRLSPRVL